MRLKTTSIEACILAGGLSSRMGRDKSRLKLAGWSLLGHVRRNASAAGLDARVIRRDLVDRCGPLGGIYTAFKTTRATAVVFLSCDMPFVSPALLKQIQREFRRRAVAVFASIDGTAGFPFVLPTSAQGLVEAQIESGDFSVQTLAKSLQSASLAVPESRRWQLFNVNTPAEFDEARRIWNEQNSSRRQTTTQTLARTKQMKPGQPILAVTNLCVRRGRVHILDNVTWRVEPRQHWVILGANGSGKTSLLGALTGYLTPTSGSIELLGQRYGQSDWRALRTKVGIVSSSIRQMMADSEPALETVASGRFAMIDYWGTPSKADRAKALRILKRIECGYLADRPWAFLSQGERQRVLIGRALMATPSVLILDEPCAGLDPIAREHFLHFLDRLGRSRRAPALVLVTHHVEEIVPVFSHVLLLKAGKVLAAGTRNNVLTSSQLSNTFDASIKLQRTGKAYRLAVSPDEGRVM